MLSDIIDLKFKGAAFDSEITIKLFKEIERERVELIFGRNGSGKSTISRAILKAIDHEGIEDIDTAQFIDSSGSVVAITADEKKHVFVFSEDYTNSRVRLREDGLSTIVMFGEIGDIADDIAKTTEYLKRTEVGYDTQSKIYAAYTDTSDIQSPENQLGKIKARLRGDNSWADRERLILGSKSNASVNDDVVREIMKSAPEEPQSDLLITYDSEYLAFNAARSAGSKINAPIPVVDDYFDKIKLINDLLAVKIEEPSLTDREKTLLALAQSGKQSMLTDIKTTFSSGTNICPFCLQPVTDEYKNDLIRNIENILNETVEEHKAALERSRIAPIFIDISPFETVDKAIADNCRTAVNVVKDNIVKYNQLIEQKIKNLYTPITDFSSELQKSVNALKIQLLNLDKKKTEYNDRIDCIHNIQSKLKILNKKLAYYEIKDLYADYKKQNDRKNSEKSKLDEIAAGLEKARNELDNLNQQKKNVRIALEFINKGLQYIFFSADRLKVDIIGDNYVLLSNNKQVKPKNISAGERNILALCYFFTELLNNTNAKDAHKTECLIVLDDPVSSFDLENRVGIISYLKSQILKTLRGNLNSRIILLSHDLLTVYDIDKALNEIAKQVKIKVNHNDQNMSYRFLELNNQNIAEFSRKKGNEYSQLLRTVYEYASNQSDEYELIIGNVIRRMIEAFGTFEYRKGIDEISCDQAILAIIKEDKRDYFENLMYRLVLNGESHLEERAKSLTDNNFFPTITSYEKKRTAKDVLCLMYLLNSNHIKAQFDAMKCDIKGDVMKDIEQWVDNIPIKVA